MRGNGCRTMLWNLSICVGALLFFSAPLCGQQASSTLPQTGTPPSDSAVALRSLTDSLRDLREQVRDLNAQMQQLRAEQKGAQAEAMALRAELGAMRQQVAEKSAPSQVESNQQSEDQRSEPPSSIPVGPYSRSQPFAPITQSSAAEAIPQALQSSDQSMDQSIDQRLARLQESQDVTAANVRELSQTRVESGSKYRLRLSGIVLLNMFDNHGTVDNLDVPEVALPRAYIDSGSAFGGTVRQSQISLDGFGPDIAGAHTSANVTVDFAGGFVAAQNGAAKPLLRLRTGTFRMDWTNTSIVAGQDSLFFVPLTPSSLASLAVPALAYSGDLWGWTPQIRIEHRIPLADNAHLLLQAGILDSLSGDAAMPGYERYPMWGEQSGQPAYAGRVAWSHPASGQDLTVGFGGYYARQDWGFGRNIDSWAGTIDMDLPLGKLFDLSAAFYRGRAVGGIGGGIGQSILANGPFDSPATIVRGLDSAGGWAQLKFKPRANFEVNGALGEDNPYAGQLKSFPASPSYYGILLSRNLSPLVNFIYQPRSDVFFSAEYRYLHTFLLSNSQMANLVSLSVGYTF
jgi:hypothetical protein